MSKSKQKIDQPSVDQVPAEQGMLKWLWLSAGVIILDYVTKLITINSLSMHERIDLLPFFSLTRAHNTGAAFSFLAGAGGWQRWLFAGVSLSVGAALVVWLKKVPKNDRWMACCLALIIGGALGNLYDRLVYGYVVDFLDFHGSIFKAVLGYSHFPAFNVADIAISVGAFMMAVDVIRNPNK